MALRTWAGTASGAPARAAPVAAVMAPSIQGSGSASAKKTAPPTAPREIERAKRSAPTRSRAARKPSTNRVAEGFAMRGRRILRG